MVTGFSHRSKLRRHTNTTNTLTSPLLLTSDALSSAELHLEGEGGDISVLDLAPTSHRRLDEHNASEAAAIVVSGAVVVYLERLAFRGATGATAIRATNGAQLILRGCELSGGSAPEPAALIASGATTSVHVIDSAFVANANIAPNSTGGAVAVGECHQLRRATKRAVALLLRVAHQVPVVSSRLQASLERPLGVEG